MSTMSQLATDAPQYSVQPPPATHRMRGRESVVSCAASAGRICSAGCPRSGDSGLTWMKIAGPPIAFIRDPEHARQVLVTNQDNYVKGNDYRILAVLLGKGLLTNFDLELWQQQRKLVQPLFAKRHLSPMATHMTAGADRWLDGMATEAQREREVDVNSAMMALTLDVVCRALFGTTTDAQLTRTVGGAMSTLLTAAQANLQMAGVYDVIETVPSIEFSDLLRVRRVHWNRAQVAKAQLDDIVYGMIDGRRASPDPEANDLLSLLLGARDEDGGGEMDREQVRDEVMTFLGAGTRPPPTPSRGSGTRSRGTRGPSPDGGRGGRGARRPHAAVRGRRAAPVDERVPARGAAALPAGSRLHARRRWRRRSRRPQGRPGTDIIISPYLIHRNPRLWDNRRALIRAVHARRRGDADGRPRLAFMPFGGGRRICVGQGFALLEGVLLAAMITQRVRFDLVPGTQVRNDVAITLRPRDGMPMTVHRREDAPPLVR